MQEIRSSKPPVGTRIYDPNKSRAWNHCSLKLGSKLNYLFAFTHCIIVSFWNLKLLSFVFIRFHLLRHSSSFVVPLVVICCHSLSFIVPRCHLLYHSLPLVLLLVVTLCHSLYHSFSFVPTRFYSLYHSLSLDVPLVWIFINDLTHWFKQNVHLKKTPSIMPKS